MKKNETLKQNPKKTRVYDEDDDDNDVTYDYFEY